MTAKECDLSVFDFEGLCELVNTATLVMKEKYNLKTGGESQFAKSKSSSTTVLPRGERITINIINDPQKDEVFAAMEEWPFDELAELVSLASQRMRDLYNK